MAIVSSNYELKSLNKSCGNINNTDISDESHSIAVEVLTSLLCESPFRSENVNQETNPLMYRSSTNIKSMGNSYFQPTVTNCYSDIPLFNTNSQYQLHKTCPNVTKINTDITNKSSLPYLSKEMMMTIHPDNVDSESLLFVQRKCRNSNTYILKKVKINEILKKREILNDNRKRVSSDNSHMKSVKKLTAQFKTNSPNQSREISLSFSQPVCYRINSELIEDSQHLKSSFGSFFENSLEKRMKSSLPLKKRKILKSTFQATKQPFNPNYTNVSVVTGDKGKIILIYKPEQSQLFSDNDEKLRKKIEIALKQDEDGDLPLHIAVAHKNLAVIGSFCKLIQQAGKTVDRFNKNKLTPLHLSVKMNYSKGVRKLIKMGADVNLSDGNGNSAVHLAVLYSHFECFDAILNTCTSMECSKPNLNSHNYEGLTPLHTAVKKENIEMIKRLLKAGANPDSKDYKSGQAPLFFAVENQNQVIIKLLLENDSSVDIQNFAGHTPFLVANGRKYQEICKLLVDWGADAHGMVFDNLACNYKTSNIKYQLKNKLVANQSSENINSKLCGDLQNCSFNENLGND